MDNSIGADYDSQLQCFLMIFQFLNYTVKHFIFAKLNFCYEFTVLGNS